ncbi:23S rRNA (adenine(2503)-C(2))-methyltransferase @ tRNA (adenine(37)-C(2))-methyltransferase, partial [hydrothermal vent metagenome]
MTDKPDFKSMTSVELEEWMELIGEARFRAKQIRSWMFDKGVSSFDEMTNISKELRDILNENVNITEIKEVNRQESIDGTLKFLFSGEDGHTFESVWIPDEKWRTLCVSTQVGCRLGCRFCLTGAGGYVRNLSAGEIVDQLVQVRKLVPGNQVTNVVLMGMGEPLDNYENVLKALKVWTEQGIGMIGARKVTLSTSGVAPMIEKLAVDFPRIKLAVSLNAVEDDMRSALMPINKKYPIARLF